MVKCGGEIIGLEKITSVFQQCCFFRFVLKKYGFWNHENEQYKIQTIIFKVSNILIGHFLNVIRAKNP